MMTTDHSMQNESLAEAMPPRYVKSSPKSMGHCFYVSLPMCRRSGLPHRMVSQRSTSTRSWPSISSQEQRQQPNST